MYSNRVVAARQKLQIVHELQKREMKQGIGIQNRYSIQIDCITF